MESKNGLEPESVTPQPEPESVTPPPEPESVTPPPPAIPPDGDMSIMPVIPNLPKRHLIVRRGVGNDGQRIKLVSNHFSIKFNTQDKYFSQYSVSIESEDKCLVEGKGIGRKVMEKLYQTYSSELDGKYFAYDGEKCLFVVGDLPQNICEFTVILEESSARLAGGSPSNGSPSEGDRKRSRHTHQAKKFKVTLTYASRRIPLQSIADAISGEKADHPQDALRVLDIILRQQQAKRGCLLVKQSFFNGDLKNFTDLGGGVSGCRGFYSSFRTTNGGLSLNMDVSTTMILTPGPVSNFLLSSQNIKDLRQINWEKAKRVLKNMRIKTTHNKMEFKIRGLSELPCKQQLFQLKVNKGNGEFETVNVSVYDYFLEKNITLTWSAHVPCLDVGRPKRPNYLPVELCHLVPLQRYTKALSPLQRATLVEKSRQKPLERIRAVTDAVTNNRYDEDPLLSSCGISIAKQLSRVDGRVLTPPTLKVGSEQDCIPKNGRWNFNNKTLLKPFKIDHWAIVNFSARCDLRNLSRELISTGMRKGVDIARPFTLIEEDHRCNKLAPAIRVEKMFDKVMAKLPGPPQLILCVLPEKKNSEIYGPWKKKNLHEVGIVTQCIAPVKINDQYLTNVLLKINSKLGGINSMLAAELYHSIPLVTNIPTLILGMDVSRGSPGRSDVPSIAAVVGSRQWPLISRYRASVRTQLPKLEMIDCLYKPQANGSDEGIMRELLIDFYDTSGGRKPEQVIIFRDGVSESQFDQVLDIELNQICKAFYHLGETSPPKFTVIVAQKKHHTKLFQDGVPDNVPAGTVVDTKVVHPRHYDFFMCAHAGMIGTSRPTHYQVLLDEIGFSPDGLQTLVFSLSYVYQRSTTAISIVAPISYAHLAAAQMSQFLKFDDSSETSSEHREVTIEGTRPVPELPPLHDKVKSSMFFC